LTIKKITTSWKNVILYTYYFISFLLAIFSFLKIYLWSNALPISEPAIVASSAEQTVNFENFQNGLIILSDAANSAGTYVWVVGGKADGVLLGGSGGGNTNVQPKFGTLTYNETLKGYVWTKPQNFPLPFITMKFVKIRL
jgi:hypothetical protein